MYALRAAVAVGLLAHGVYQFENDPTWWLCCPFYVSAALLSLLPFPNLFIWRLLSAFAVMGGGSFMLFLAYTFHSLDGATGLSLIEGDRLLPISVGVALITATRLAHGRHSSPLEFIKGFILTGLFFASFGCMIFSAKFFNLHQ
ncbi:unnamed protein product, partial [Mesorhabditis belari]|uniref:Uncharacterized protein n=1 Tax=Mesorhabditis belari TaxID=2138241 RepID=A0AAF3ERU3_9BILA